jgi:hypothetical protein
MDRNYHPHVTLETHLFVFFIRLSGQLVTYPLDIVRRRMQMAMITSDGKYLSLRYVSHYVIFNV